jgi:competence protein ComEC
VLLSQGNNHYLFTGDLEESGEKSLIEANDLPKCKLYKAGHHGSKTSSTAELLAFIQPEIVVANCCSGGKHDFPHQEFIDNVSLYTDKVYIPIMKSDNDAGFTFLNGNIVVSSNGAEVNVQCSNNNVLFKNTDWFKENRILPNAWRE